MTKSNINQSSKDIFNLGMAEAISQGLSLFIGLYLISYLTQENYGKWALILAFVNLFRFTTFGGLQKPLIREMSKNQSHYLELISSIINFKSILSIVGIILCTIALYFTNYSFDIKLYIVILSLSLFADHIRVSFSPILNSLEKFRTLSIITIQSSILRSLLFITIILVDLGLFYLVLSHTFTSFFKAVLTLYQTYSYSTVFAFSKLKQDFLLVKQGLVFTLWEFAVTILSRFDVIFLSLYSNPIQIAIYALPNKIANEILIFRNIISTAILPKAIKNYEKFAGNKNVLYNSSILLFSLVSIGIFLLSFITSDLISFLFGDEYVQSSHLLIVLLISQSFAFACIPFTTYIQASYREIQIVYINSIAIIIKISLSVYLFSIYGLIGLAYSAIAANITLLLGYSIISSRI